MGHGEARLGDLLEEWALAILNGVPELEQDFDPNVRRASLWKLCAAAVCAQGSFSLVQNST